MSVEPQSMEFTFPKQFAAFDLDGQLAVRGEALGSLLEPEYEALAERYWAERHRQGLAASANHAEQIERTVAYSRQKFSHLANAAWAVSLAKLINESRASGASIVDVMAAACAANRDLVATIVRVSDPELLSDHLRTLFTVCELEAAIIADAYWQIEKNKVDRSREEVYASFDAELGKAARGAAEQSDALRRQSMTTSGLARGMLGKASEVAAASEQSAIAMREAAQTAAGLIRAIEDARREVEAAGDIAGRAVNEASDAVNATETLSGHAESIESILGLIRDIAGQTNLLALNATIEAARAGDAGRGFAVVAQEVKSLANQTAQATDDIATKIGAIQGATKATVKSNASIRDTVSDVLDSAVRIRQAMESQAQTVTMITAAVDETALAADSMSNTIAAIRIDTESVANEIDSLTQGFAIVDQTISSLQTDAAGFLRRA